MSRENEEFAKEAWENLSSFVNKYGFPEKEFVEFVMMDHRTLQQSMMRLFLGCIKAWAEKAEKGEYDLRNEQTCKLCQKIVARFDNEMGLPFI